MSIYTESDRNFQYFPEIVDTIRHPLIILDEEITVQLANRAFYTTFLMNKEETEGYKIYELGNGQWDIPELRELLDEVLSENKMIEDYEIEHDYRSIGHRILILNARVIKINDERKNLILLSLEDKTKTKTWERKLIATKEFNEKIIETIREPLLILDTEFNIIQASSRFYEEFRISENEVIENNLIELDQGQWDIPELRDLLQNVLPDNKSFEDFKVSMKCKRIGFRHYLLNGRRLDHMSMIFLAFEDITEKLRKKEIEEEIKHRLEEKVKEQTAQVRYLANEISKTEQQERQKISQILHDELQQILVCLKMSLAQFKIKLTKNELKDEDDQKYINKTESMIQNAIELTRSLSHQLSPVMLYHEEFDETIRWLCRHYKELYQLEIELSIELRDQSIEEGVKFFLYHSLRELLLNVVKHAEVDLAYVTVNQGHDDFIHLIVHDEGKGCDSKEILENNTINGMGVKNIKHRVELMGGSFHIENPKEKGCRMQIKCPTKIG